MKQANEDRAQMTLVPPVYFLSGLGLGLLLDWLLPAPALAGHLFAIGGSALILAAGTIVLSALTNLRRARTAFDVRKPTTRIVTSGAYRWSRNPIYLAGLLLVTGIGLVSDTFWILPMLPVIVVVVNRAVIAPEEQYLEAKFGQEYLHYKSTVRRWL